MIEEDYVSFETAKLLKETDFEGKIKAYYHIWDNGKRVCSVQEYIHSEAPHLYIPAPTLQMAMKWLREEKQIFIRIIQSHIEYCSCEIYYNKVQYYQFIESFNSYEQAAEAAIKYCLENLI